jgi:hypothetical protein
LFGVLFCPSLKKGVVIMALLPLTTCAQMLGIHPKTLHHWLKEAKVPLAPHPSDARLKCLSEQHLSLVARLHDRSLPQRPCVTVSPEEQAPSFPGKEEELEPLACSLPTTRAAEPDLMQKLICLEIKW